jgi:hypothetical protein
MELFPQHPRRIAVWTLRGKKLGCAAQTDQMDRILVTGGACDTQHAKQM